MTIGNGIDRILADAGYRGHNAPFSHKFKVFTSGQKRRMTPAIKREMKRRAAIEPVIGHITNEHRMGRNYLAHQQGDAINAVYGSKRIGSKSTSRAQGTYILDWLSRPRLT